MKKLIKLQGGGITANPGVMDALKGFVTDSSAMSGLGASIGSALQAGGNSYWSKQGSQGVTNAIASMPDMVNQIQGLKGLKGANLAGGIGGLVGTAADMVGGFVEPGTTESGEHGNITKGIDAGYDAIADAAMQMGPWGMVVGGAMKANALMGDVISKQSINGRALGTSGQTKSDAILGSAFFESNIGAINAYFGEDMDKLELDQKTWDTVGSSYAGALKDASDASENTGGRYGWLSTVTGEYSDDYSQMIDAKIQQEKASLIADEATESREISESTANEALLNRRRRMSGQNQQLIVKNGMKLPSKEDIQRIKQITTPKNNWEPVWNDYPELFKGGGKTKKKEEKPKTRSIEELIQYAKEQNPRFIQRMSEPLRYIRINTKNENGEDMWNHATHMMNHRGNIVYPMIQEINGKLHMFNNEDEAFEYAKATENILNFNSEDEAKLFVISDKDENGNYFGYKLGWPEFFETSPIDVKEESSVDKFKEGGKMNIIPEGELHARLHHMEQEGITKKGIPVISIEEGGEVIQHAEIERNEIIFRLELTQKLEKLMEDGSDEAALEAGKLLADEILNNTEDRTGLLNEVE